MFDVFADDICFNNRTVARIVDGIPATVRDEVESFFNGTPEGFLREEDHEAALKEVEEDSYNQGRAEGEREGRREAERELREEHEEALKLAFENGRRAAAEAIGKAEDVARVDALLARVATVEAELRRALNGVREEGKARPRQLKPAEFKTVVRECYLALNEAKCKFRHD